MILLDNFNKILYNISNKNKEIDDYDYGLRYIIKQIIKEIIQGKSTIDHNITIGFNPFFSKSIINKSPVIFSLKVIKCI